MGRGGSAARGRGPGARRRARGLCDSFSPADRTQGHEPQPLRLRRHGVPAGGGGRNGGAAARRGAGLCERDLPRHARGGRRVRLPGRRRRHRDLGRQARRRRHDLRQKRRPEAHPPQRRTPGRRHLRHRPAWREHPRPAPGVRATRRDRAQARVARQHHRDDRRERRAVARPRARLPREQRRRDGHGRPRPGARGRHRDAPPRWTHPARARPARRRGLRAAIHGTAGVLLRVDTHRDGHGGAGGVFADLARAAPAAGAARVGAFAVSLATPTRPHPSPLPEGEGEMRTTASDGSMVVTLFFAAATFLGAFLLFLVQPLIAKYILPWFGGGAAVWTTCMLFFQTALLAGYLYAHLGAVRLPTRAQAVLHVVILAAAVAAAVPSIAPATRWKPPVDAGGANPTWRIMLLLTVTVGLPCLALAATSPLLHAWYSRLRPGAAVYRLYALSNVGSLLALLAY